MVHAYDPSTWEAEAEGSQFKASLGYIMSSRPARDIQWDRVSKKKEVFHSNNMDTYKIWVKEKTEENIYHLVPFI
jgi:hypothetical protein